MSVELSTAGRRRGRNRRPADRPWITLESQFVASTKWVPLHVVPGLEDQKRAADWVILSWRQNSQPRFDHRSSKVKKQVPFSLAALLLLTGNTLAVAATSGMSASPPSLQEAQSAAAKLGQLYDSNYAAKNAAAMAKLYAEDGTLVSPAGKIIKGRAALKQYYENRFGSGAKAHHIHVIDANVQGNGGFSIAEFSVEVPKGDGTFRQASGHIIAVYEKDSDGWHFRALEPSVAAKE
jgi:uncharacterized protein (TIGR02246 family)